MAVLKNAAPVHESAGGSGAWSRVEMWVLGLAIALVIASVALGPALAHAGR